MKKRIYRSMGLLILLTVTMFAVMWGLVFSGVFGSQIMEGLRTLRVSIIDAQGTVIFDNIADPTTMENHLDRPEVRDALQSIRGESERFSETLGETTRYYAVRMADGNVLRLAFTTENMARFMRQFVPIVVICLILAAWLALLAAGWLTNRITGPINSMDLNAPELTKYEELLPFMKKITAQKREIAEKIAALNNRADTISAITENMREGLILLDHNGIVLTYNKSTLDIFDDVERKNILHVCRDVEFQHGVKQCISGKNAEIVFERGDKIYNVYFSPVNNEVDTGGAVVLFFDVTERHRAEQQRREFSANVSHELKTPLTSICALSEMIGNGMAKQEDINGFAAKISEQAKTLIDIINDIIKLSEFDEGKAGRGYEVFGLYELAETVADALRENDRGIEIMLSGERFGIAANRRMIDELLYNLIDNGIRYNKDGGSVTVELLQENGLCKIAVSDTGIGISKEHQSRVFERFYRVDSSRSKKTGGTGLGLSIVKHIAEHHGGKVELNSLENKGTTVTCRLAMKEL